MVPRTIRRDKAVVMMSEDETAGGKGIWENASRCSATRSKQRNNRGPKNLLRELALRIDLSPIVKRRLKDRGTKTRMVVKRNIRENFQFKRRVLERIAALF
jgi:hypothetical protein